MDTKPPFSEKGASELTKIGNTIFQGGTVTDYSAPNYKEWHPYITAFLSCIDREHGSLLNFPFDGGVFNQPYHTMLIFDLLGTLFRQAINKHLKELNKKR